MPGIEPIMDDIFHQQLLNHADVRQADAHSDAENNRCVFCGKGDKVDEKVVNSDDFLMPHHPQCLNGNTKSAGESTSDDFYGGDKPDDYYDDLDDGPEGEDKHPDPFVQRMREQEKNGS